MDLVVFLFERSLVSVYYVLDGVFGWRVEFRGGYIYGIFELSVLVDIVWL